MNLLSRARLSGRIRLSSLYSTTSHQQWNSYTTSKTPKSPNPKSPKSPAPSSSISERMKKLTGEPIVWPKPSEIPYQAKVANFVNLIGYVKAPVQFDSAPEGFSAATAISQEFTGGMDSLLIPVVFEGDLAHVVATHVKENDCVLVSGQLSSEPSRFSLEEGFGKFHVVCENLNFVQGFQSGYHRKKSVSAVGVKKPADGGTRNVVEGVSDEKFNRRCEKSVSAVGAKKPADGGTRNVVEGVSDEKFNRTWEKALEKSEVKNFSDEANWEGARWGTGEPTIVRGEAESGDSSEKKKDGAESGVKKKDGAESWVKKKDEDLWRDLVRNSPHWWDFRDLKAKGQRGEKFPDFKHKENGNPLWINSAPTWVLPGIEKLEFDAPVARVQTSQGSGERKGNVADEESWKDLVENPSKWWDNRTNKRNPKGPDFKQKETGQGLWLNSSPDWALSKLPPLK